MKKLLLIAGVAAPLALSGAVYAATVPSDFAKDVNAGQSQLSSDQNAKTQANEVKDGESVEAQVDDGQVQVDETVGQQENNMDDNQSGEASHSEASTSTSDSANGGTGTTSSYDQSTGSVQTNGSTNQ